MLQKISNEKMSQNKNCNFMILYIDYLLFLRISVIFNEIVFEQNVINIKVEVPHELKIVKNCCNFVYLFAKYLSSISQNLELMDNLEAEIFDLRI